MLNNLNRMILNLILAQSEPVAGQELAARCGVSINTIRKEISFLNETMMPHGCYIEAKAASGFGLTVMDHDLADAYIAKLHMLCRRNSNLSRHDSERVRRLIRECLCSTGQLTVQMLCDRLYCSQSTVLRELNQVREAIAPFFLKLVNRKNAGLHVEGNEWHIRQCLIHQHKLWMLFPKESDGGEYTFKSQFLMLDGVNWYDQLRTSLIEMLSRQQDFRVPYMFLPKIIHYVQVSTTRHKFASNCVFTPEQRTRALGTVEHAFAQRWVGALPDRMKKTEDVILGVTMLLMSYETWNGHLAQLEEYDELLAARDSLLDVMRQQWGRQIESADADFRQDWLCFQYALQNRTVFQVYNDTEYLGSIRRKGIRSLDMCIFFALWHKSRYGITLTRENAQSPSYIFHRLMWTVGFHRTGPNIVVFSRYGLYYAKSFARKLKDIYNPEVGQVTARELGEPWSQELLECDLVVTDLDRDQFQRVHNAAPPTLWIDFRLGGSRYSELDEFLKSRRVAEERSRLSAGCIRRSGFSSKKEVFSALGQWMALEGEDAEKLTELLRMDDLLVNCERQNKAVFLPLFTQRQEKSRIYVFINEKPLPWVETECRIFVGYTRTPVPGENEIINSILKKFIYLPPELLADLLEAGLREDHEAFWDILEMGEIIS